jgi:hypothetical protein
LKIDHDKFEGEITSACGVSSLVASMSTVDLIHSRRCLRHQENLDESFSFSDFVGHSLDLRLESQEIENYNDVVLGICCDRQRG